MDMILYLVKYKCEIIENKCLTSNWDLHDFSYYNTLKTCKWTHHNHNLKNIFFPNSLNIINNLK
jgi:hypothetical protein